MESDSDSDFEDAVTNDNTEETSDVTNIQRKERGNINSGGKRVRGNDVTWSDYKSFDNAEEYLESEIYGKLKTDFTLRRSNEWDYGEVEIFTCKYSRRTGYLPCPWMLKTTFLANSDAVVVETADGVVDHHHEEDPDYVSDNLGYKWSRTATEIITTGVRNEARPKLILRNLRDANVFDEGAEPTMIQLYNKISHIKHIINKTKEILTTHDLRQKITEYLDVPDSDIEAFVPFYEIEDDDMFEEPRFTVIFTSQKLLKRINSDFVFQLDATYRLMWQGFPFFVT